MTTLAERIDAIKDLIQKREEIDRQLEAILVGGTFTTRKLKCSICGSDHHTARTCPQRHEKKETPQSTPATEQHEL